METVAVISLIALLIQTTMLTIAHKHPEVETNGFKWCSAIVGLIFLINYVWLLVLVL